MLAKINIMVNAQEQAAQIPSNKEPFPGSSQGRNQ